MQKLSELSPIVIPPAALAPLDVVHVAASVKVTWNSSPPMKTVETQRAAGFV